MHRYWTSRDWFSRLNLVTDVWNIPFLIIIIHRIKRVSKKYLAPSIYSYPYWRLKSNIRFYKGVFCLFGHPLYHKNGIHRKQKAAPTDGSMKIIWRKIEDLIFFCCFYFSIGLHLYSKVIRSNISVADLWQRPGSARRQSVFALRLWVLSGKASGSIW